VAPVPFWALVVRVRHFPHRHVAASLVRLRGSRLQSVIGAVANAAKPIDFRRKQCGYSDCFRTQTAEAIRIPALFAKPIDFRRKQCGYSDCLCCLRADLTYRSGGAHADAPCDVGQPRPRPHDRGPRRPHAGSQSLPEPRSRCRVAPSSPHEICDGRASPRHSLTTGHAGARRSFRVPQLRVMITASAFRRIALGMSGAIEGAHMGHPDFRANGKIFATLHADDKHGMVKLAPDRQRDFVRAYPEAFTPENGAWGRQGCMRVRLAAVDEDTLGEAM